MAQQRRPRRRRSPVAGERVGTRRSAALRMIRRASLARLRIGFLLISMVVSVFAVRLFQLQGIDAEAYAAQARAVGAVQEVLPAVRGSILDRNGVPLAESLDGSMVVADPTKTKDDAAEIASVLQERLGVDYIETVERLQAPNTRFRYIARRVPTTDAVGVVEELTEAGYKGLDTRRDPVRSYPAQDVAANILGYVNAKDQPVAGIEDRFNTLLSGTDGSATYDIGGGNRVPLGDNSVTEPVDGKDLTLTIDRDLQWYVQRVLSQTVEDAGGVSGVAVVQDTRTGELLSVADYPTYNPNDMTQRDPDALASRAFRDVYEPGSVQKVLTIAALLDAGLMAPDTQLTIPSEIESSGGKMIGDYSDHGTLHYTLTGVLARSSNIGTVLAAREMRAAQLYRYLRDFGLGRLTGIPGYAESAGILAPPSEWQRINHDNIAFGQGLAVNAVQMTAAINTIANGGVYVQPSLVKGQATTRDGVLTGSEVAVQRRVVSEEVAEDTSQMMEMVTTEGAGTAPGAAIEGYRVAGKTGTAQMVNEACQCYDGTKFTVSFAGFAPAEDPRFTVYVVVHEPSNGGGGGSVGGPAFRKILSYLLQHYAVPPTGAPAPDLSVKWRPGSRAEGTETGVVDGRVAGRLRNR